MIKPKKILIIGILSSIAILSSGCMEQPKPEVKTIHTTSEVLIPYNDRVKKAVVVLISKIKSLEEQVNKNTIALKNPKDSALSLTNSLKIKGLGQKLKELEKLGSDNNKSITFLKSRKIKCPPSVENVATPTETIVNGNTMPNDNDSIIKEFIEDGTLK